MRRIEAFGVAGLAIAVVGCASRHEERWMVIDAESAAPISRAVVSVSYPSLFDPFPPKSESGLTDPSGIVVLRVLDEPCMRVFGAKAEGYAELDRTPEGIKLPPGVSSDRILALRPVEENSRR